MMKRCVLILLTFCMQFYLLQAGELDLTFNDVGYTNYFASSQGAFKGIVYLPNGTILAGGCVYNQGPVVINYKLDGSLNTSYGSGGIASTAVNNYNFTFGLELQSDGKSVLLGSTGPQVKLFRYTVDGVLDTTFGSNGIVTTSPILSGYSQLIARGIAIQADDKIVVTALARLEPHVSPFSIGSLVRYNANGSVDTTFGSNGMLILPFAAKSIAVAIDTNQKIVVGGDVIDSNASVFFVRYNSDGSLDTTFNEVGYIQYDTSDSLSLSNLLVESDNKIVGVGTATNTKTPFLLRYNSDGSLDSTFGNQTGYVNFTDLGIESYGSVVTKTLDNKYIIGGSARLSVNNGVQYHFFVFSAKQDGSLNSSFASGDGYTITPIGTSSSVSSIAMQDDGKYLLGGNGYITSSWNNVLVRYHGLSLEGPSLKNESFGDAGSITLYADGASSAQAHQEVKGVRQLISGRLMTVVSDGIESWTVRMNEDGTYDETYGNGQGILIGQRAGNETVTGMELGDVGDLMIVGNHSVFGGYLKRVLSDGTMNPLFGGSNGDPVGTVYNIMSDIYAVTQLSNGNMLVVGNHNGVGQAVMLSPTGTVVTEFGTNGVYNNGENIVSVSVDSNNNIYMAVGYLDSVKKARIIKMSATGVLDTTFGAGGIVNSVFSGIDSYDNIRLALDQDGYVVVVSSQEVGVVSVVRYTSQGVFDTTFNSGSRYDVVIKENSNVVVTRVMPLENGKIVISGYENGESDKTWFVFQVTSLGVLDSEYNPEGDAPGLYTFAVSDDSDVAPKNYDAVILSNGNFLFAGSESLATNESTPLIVSVLGNEGVQGVVQYPEIVNVLAVPIYTTFGSGGEIVSNSVSALLSGGFIAFGTQGLTNIGGVTNDSTLIVSRFAKTGEIVTAYGTNGIATSPEISNLVHGGMIAVDGNNKVVVGGYTSDGRLVAVRFTTTGLLDTTFGVSGVVQTSVITNLQAGGFVGVDFNNKVIIGGVTSDGTLVVARYTAAGILDATFGTAGMSTTGVISNLIGGGSLVVNSTTNEVFVSGYTSTGKLVVTKFTSYGILDTNFGTSGIATTGIIDNLAGIGSITLDAYYRPVVGGYTLYKRLVVVRFGSGGTLDTTFNTTGLVLTSPISGLVRGGFVDVDNLNRVVIGGLSSIFGVKNLVVGRFLGTGSVDTTFSPDGLATTGVIANLTEGGPVAVDGVDRILIAGVTIDGDVGSLIGKKLLSGDEIVLLPEEQAAPVDFKIFYYGGNPNLFRRIILVDYYLSQIPDATVRDAVTQAINVILSNYADAFDGQGGFYLTASLSKINFLLQVAENKLLEAYPENQEEIEQFFTSFQARIDALQR